MGFARVGSGSASRAESFWSTPFFAVLMIATAGVVAYLNAFATPFVFDDEPSILANPSIRSFAHAWSPPVNGGITVAGRPLLNFSFAVNYAISGTDPWSYHIANLLVHLMAGVLLFVVVRRTLVRPALAAKFGPHAFEIALLAALLWTVHPLQTESVTYVVQRAESLMGMFFLLTLWCFIRASEEGAARHWRWGAVLACGAGMATKEVMVVAPLIVLLYDRTFVAGSFRAAWRERAGLHGALAATWLLLAGCVVSAGSRGGTFALSDPRAWWRYDLTQFVAVLHYLRLAVWPHPLVIDYGTFWVGEPLAVLPSAVVIMALFVASVVALVRWPIWGFLGAWFFLLLAPSSVLPGTIQMIVEHRMYLPLAALVVLGSTAGYARWGRRTAVILGAAALVLLAVTVRRNQDYSSAIRLFEDTVAQRPGNARAMALLADYYRRVGQSEKARAWLERSNAIEPGVSAVLNNLGTVCQELGDYAAAVGHFEAALALQPANATTLSNLGNALVLAGRADAGIAKLEAALKLAPDLALTRGNLANVLTEQGRATEAVAQLEIQLKNGPDDAEAHANYARALQALGRGAEAIAQLEVAVRLQPRDGAWHNRLGAALGRAGRMREALEQFQEAIRLNPTDESAQKNAARAVRMLGGS